MNSALPIQTLREVFAARLQENVVLSNYTTTRAGGAAVALLPVNSLAELEDAAMRLWALDAPFKVLGSGSNVLVADGGYHGVVLLNRARNIKIDTRGVPPTLWAESGANLGSIARQAALRGLSGMEWAATVPGTLGGALYGNAGAHGGDMAGNLILADILHRTDGRQSLTVDQMGYQYRSSALKRDRLPMVLLAARLKMQPGDPAEIQAKMDGFSSKRRATQPPGATMGSMFKNPPGDYAGRLIEAAGLKGKRSGGAAISELHANFFVNEGGATAEDIYRLINLAQRAVADKFGIALELEIELLGDFSTVEPI